MLLPSPNPVVSCLIKVCNGFTFLVPAYPDCPGKEAIKWVCVCCADQLDLYMQGQEKAILDDNETEDHDPTTNVIGQTCLFSYDFLS